MESSKKIIVFWLILMANFTVWAGGKNSPPDDVLTLEALIEVHKKMKKAEDAAVLELGETTITHYATTDLTSKYNQTRKMLNQRLADVGSALTLASSLVSIGIQIKDLTESYAEFTKTTYYKVQKHPFLLLVYTNANLQIASEIKHITKCCADYVGFQTNILKATMDEKRQLLGFISARISSVQRIINRVSLTIRSVCASGVKEYHVYDIINSKTNKDIMNKAIGKWTGKAQK